MKKINKKKVKRIIYPIVLLIIFVLDIFLVKTSLTDRVETILLGDNLTNVNIYETYEDDGFNFYVNDELISPEFYTYKTESNVDTMQIGEYNLKYIISYKDKNYEVTRKINVNDIEPPVIITNNDVVYKYYCNENQNDGVNYQAYDNYDGRLSDKVSVEKNDDGVILSVEDSSGNKSTKKLNYQVVDTAPPVINLNGSSTVYVKNGNSYNEKGFTVKDGCGKDLDSSLVTTAGSVDTSTNGTYTLTYSITYDDMTSTATRKVIVYTPSTSKNTTVDGTGKTVYLTFDDGPGVYTKEFLDILDQYNVKATFFVTNQFPNYSYLIKEEYNRGHAIAVHTYSHKYNIYSSVETYVKDFNDMNNIIEKQIGHKVQMFRFPGGSSNTISKNYSVGIMTALASYMQEQGYEYYDWNVSSEDASGANSDKIYQSVINGVHGRNTSIVLCHDIHKTTLNALPRILETLTNEGYTFKTLDLNSPKAHHGINN